MNWKIVGTLLLASGLLSSCSSKKPRPSPDHYCSPEGSFCIEVPGAPKIDKESQDIPNQVSMFMKKYEWGEANDMVYLVLAIDATPATGVEANFQGALDKVVEGIGKRMGGNVVGKKDVDVAGRKGTETLVENPKGFRMALRGLIVDQRIYIIVIGAPFANWDAAETARYFDSFKL